MIRGAEQLTSIFGHWPTFHDAEVTRLILDRARASDSAFGPTLLLDVYAFRFGPEITPDGAYVLHDQVLVSFRFLEITELSLEGFNAQNALWKLAIVDIRERQLERITYEVDLAPSHGIGARFQCYDAEVVSVRPWTR